jgi:hypothetical protein
MRRAAVVSAAVAAVVLVGCSSGSKTPKVASLGSTTATTQAASSGSGGGSPAADLAKLESYASCMRSHGIGDFPDPVTGPNGGTGFQIKAGPGSDLDPNSTQYQAADKACRSLLPNGGVARQMTPAQQQKFLAWAACIRAHGVPNFPDPIFSNGGVEIRMAAPANASGVPSGPPPQLQAAQQACKSMLPGGGPGALP